MPRLPLIEPRRNELEQRPCANTTVGVPACSGSTIQDGRVEYQCPGESHSISRSIHLARLASGYATCQMCAFRDESGALPNPLAREMGVPALSGSNHDAFDGIRRIYLNELDRTKAARWAEAFASMIWDRQPRFGRPMSAQLSTVHATTADAELNEGLESASGMPSVRPQNTSRPGPMIVVGFDERPSSPDIVVGMALGLRRMGCNVVDLGQTSAPCFRFAVHHLEAAGGVYVTGAGCDPAWTGFNLMGSDALPWTNSAVLKELQSRMTSGVARPTRTTGSQRSFHATVPYEAGLWKHFHALRPLRIVCGVSNRLLPRLLESLFARLPCHLTIERLPVRHRDLSDPADPDVRKIASSVCAGQMDAGVIVDEDGQRCAFLTDNGRLVSQVEIAALLIRLELREQHSPTILVDDPLKGEISNHFAAHSISLDLQSPGGNDLPTAMLKMQADLGFGMDHRLWFRGPHVGSDAIVSLARVLQALSLSDNPMSDVLARLKV